MGPLHLHSGIPYCFAFRPVPGVPKAPFPCERASESAYEGVTAEWQIAETVDHAKYGKFRVNIYGLSFVQLLLPLHLIVLVVQFGFNCATRSRPHIKTPHRLQAVLKHILPASFTSPSRNFAPSCTR